MSVNLVNEYTDCFGKVTSGGGIYFDIKKQIILPKWYEIYERYYTPFSQYGKCKDNDKFGVLTPRGYWSPINQFNTNASVQSNLAEYLNKRIDSDFISKGITQTEFGDVRPIEMSISRIHDLDYLKSELENYFWWLDFYGEDIFINQKFIPKNHILGDLIDIAVETMARGKYGEFLTEYHLRMKRPELKINRTTMVKGSHDDMVRGTDLITYVENMNGTVTEERYQIKVMGISNNNSFYKNINYTDYHNKGVNFLVAVSLNRIGDFSSKRHITVLHMDPKFYSQTRDYKNRAVTKFTNDAIVMNDELDYISTDKIFYEFFLYCTKHDLNFVLEFDDTEEGRNYELWGTVSMDFDPDKNIVNLVLPRKRENYYKEDVIVGWRKIAQSIESGPQLEETLRRLTYLENRPF